MAIQTGQNILANDFWRISLETSKSNTGNFAEETILSGTLPASVLTTGRHIRVNAIFSELNRTTNGVSGGCTFNLYIGTTVIATIAAPTNVNLTQVAELDAILRYNGSSTAQAACMILKQGSLNTPTVATGTATENVATTKTVKLAISGSGGNYTTNACTIELV